MKSVSNTLRRSDAAGGELHSGVRDGSSSASARATRVIQMAVWFALAGALTQLVILAVWKWGFDRVTKANPQIVWMGALALLVAFAFPAVVLAVASRRWPRLLTFHAVAWVLAFMAFLNLLLMYQQLHTVAILVLAAGLATQAARMIARRPDSFGRLVRRTVWGMAAAVVAMGIGLNAWWALAERRAIATLPTPAAGAPNVLLIILDTVRSASMSLYGYERLTTPHLGELARRSVVFDYAIATSSWTLPSHASLMTGYWPHEVSANWHTPLDGRRPTLAEAFASRGYRTGGFAANPIFTTREYGIARGFSRYRDFTFTPGEIINNSPLASTIAKRPLLRRIIGNHDVLGRKTAPMVTRELLGWLRSGETERPFFAFLNYFDAHDPYLPPPPFESRFGPVEARNNHLIRAWGRRGGRLNKVRFSRGEFEGMIAAYDGTIAALDHEMGLLFDSLRARGVLENTVVIITSDHGEFLGEHGLFEHSTTPFMPVVRVPLLIFAPGRAPEGTRVAEPVTLRDVPASLMSLIGASSDAAFPGDALSRHWGAHAPAAEPAISGLASDPGSSRKGATSPKTTHSVVMGRYHYLRHERIGHTPGPETLFDYVADPAELRDLVRVPERRSDLERLRAALDSVLGRTPRPPVPVAN